MVTVLVDRRTVADIAEEFCLPLAIKGRRVSVQVAMGGRKVEFYGMVPVIGMLNLFPDDPLEDLKIRK